MSIQALNHVRTLRAGGFAQGVLLYLAMCHNAETGQCNPTRENIRDFFEPCDIKRIDRALSALKTKGFISAVKKPSKDGIQNWYSFPLMQGVPQNDQHPQNGMYPKTGATPQNGEEIAPKTGAMGTPQNGEGKRKEKRKEKESSKTSFSIPRPEDVPEQLWADFVTHRKAKKAPITETVIKRTRSEAAKCSMTLSQAIEMMVARGWQGFEARYVLDNRPKNQFCPDYRESTPAPNPAHNPFIPRRAKTPEELQAEKEQREAEELFGGLFR